MVNSNKPWESAAGMEHSESTNGAAPRSGDGDKMYNSDTPMESATGTEHSAASNIVAPASGDGNQSMTQTDTTDRQYIQVIPTDEQYDPATVPAILEGLHYLTSEASGGFFGSLLGREEPPTFEFLVVNESPQSMVQFYYGVDEEHLSRLETALRNIYPETFDVEQTSVPLGKKLVRPVVGSYRHFVNAVKRGDTMADVDLNPPDESGSALVEVPDEAVDPAEVIEEDEPRTALSRPTRTGKGSIFYRPSFDRVRPVGVRWDAVGARSKDWMCKLSGLSECMDSDTGKGHAPLAPLIDHIGKAERPVAFQVVFKRRPDWTGERSLRITDLKKGNDTRVSRALNSILGSSMEERDLEELSTHERERVEEIEAATPERSFNATLRLVTVQSGVHEPPEVDTEEYPEVPPVISDIEGQLGEISGRYYELEPTRFRELGLGLRKTKTAHREFRRFREGDLCTKERGRVRPNCVVSPDELASLLTVPPKDQFSARARRETRAGEQALTPLPRPLPDRLDPFDVGMDIGYPLDVDRMPAEDLVKVPPELLTGHYGIYSRTGHGKSTLAMNMLLSNHAASDGPTVLIDRKGGGMVQEYLQAHYQRFGDVSDVLYFPIPEVLPALPFFDVRPGMAAGRDRASVVQDKVEHFRQLLRLIMGWEQHDQAFVANSIMAYLIKALFDREHQSDAFGIDDLFQTVRNMQAEEYLPPVSSVNAAVNQSLRRQLDKDDYHFDSTMDAVGNRLDKIRENDHLRQILSHVPEWDAETESYADGAFDFRDILDEDVVVVFDLGRLESESSRALTLLLLSNLWDALQARRQPTLELGAQDDPLVNVLIEEAAPVAASPLVYEDLLPQGREFGLGLGIVLQFPEQVKAVTGGHQAGERAYTELLNNVKTRIFGNFTLNEDYAKSLVTEDLSVDGLRERFNRMPKGVWLVDLTEAGFQTASPAPFTVKSPDPPKGHPANDPLSGVQVTRFGNRLEAQIRQTIRACCIRHASTVPEYVTSSSADDEPAGQQAQSEASVGGEEGFAPDLGEPEQSAAPQESESGAVGIDHARSGTDASFTEPSSTDGAGHGSSAATAVDAQAVGESPSSRDTTIDSEPRRDSPAAGNGTQSNGTRHSGQTTSGGGDGDPGIATRSTQAAGSSDGGRQTQLDEAESVADLDIDDDNDAESVADLDLDAALSETVDSFVEETLASPQEMNPELDPHEIVLKRVRDVEHRELAGYSLLDGMTDVVDVEGVDVDELVETGCLERDRVFHNTYYSTTEEGRKILSGALLEPVTVPSGDDADLGEKTPHRAGVEYTREWFAQDPAVENVETYHDWKVGTFDVVAIADGELVRVAEVELPHNNYDAVVEDYDQMKAVDAEAIWVVRNRKTALETVLPALASKDRIPEVPEGRNANEMGSLRETIEEWELPGMDTIVSFRNVAEEVDR